MSSLQEILEKIVDNFEDSVIIAAPSGLIKKVNISAARRFDCSMSRICSMSLGGMVESVGEGKGWAEIREEILHNEYCSLKVHFAYSGDKDSFCTMNAFRVCEENGEVSDIVLILHDISEEQKFASQLEQKNLDMARINSELIRSNTELKRVSELKSNFLSIASHELKTPLTSIKGYSEIMIENMKDYMDASAFRMLESIARAADRLHRVINNMLDVTRIEQKRLRLNPENIKLAQIARECIEELSQFSDKRNIGFNCDLSDELPEFYGDKMRMQQVFTNLLSNALKYSPDSSQVEVRIFVEEEERFHIVIKDHGIGIDKREQAHIFDPFYEIGNAFKHNSDFSRFMGGGTGLGLSIVKGIVERHGGRIWVHSSGMNQQEYPGSEFHVVLPVQSRIQWDDNETKMISMSTIEAQEQEGVHEPREREISEKKPKILIIDDDKEAIEICKVVLGKSFDIIVAESGEQGLGIAFGRKVSLILLDLYLPGMNGTRICRILRSQEETRYLPIAFFSAGTQNDEVQECFASGADDFIVKPFGSKELIEKIWRLLMRKKEQSSFP